MDVPCGTRILPYLVLAFLLAGPPATSLAESSMPAPPAMAPAAPSAPPGATKEGASQTSPQTAPIPLSDIPLQAEAATKTLGNIQQELESDPATADILAKLPPDVRSIEQMRRGPEGKISPEMSLQNLAVMRRQWALYRI